jgi:hypothetical protein
MGRRVSFAPDAVLETRHMYARVGGWLCGRVAGVFWATQGLKSGAARGRLHFLKPASTPTPLLQGDDRSAPSPGAAAWRAAAEAGLVVEEGDAEGAPTASPPRASPPADAHAAITSVHSPEGTADPANITAGVPSLASLAEEDEWGEGEGGDDAPPPVGDVTASVPRLATLLEEDDDDAQPAVAFSPAPSSAVGPSPAPPGSAGAWGGALPGADTTDLDLAGRGRALMGDATFHAIYGGGAGGGRDSLIGAADGDATGATTAGLPPRPPRPSLARSSLGAPRPSLGGRPSVGGPSPAGLPPRARPSLAAGLALPPVQLPARPSDEGTPRATRAAPGGATTPRGTPIASLPRSAVGLGSASRARRTPLGGGALPPSAGRLRVAGTPGSVGLAARRASALAQLPPSAGGGGVGGLGRASTGGRTPTGPLAAPPITFQDFLGAVDLQFLDHMRRGTSISLADLGSDPPPTTLRDAYVLLGVTAPAVAALEAGVATLRDEVAARKATIVDKEAALARANPPLFGAVQTAAPAELETLRSSVALLKRVCRARTAVAWKEWRARQEADRSSSLAKHVDLLRADAAFLDGLLSRTRAAGGAARAWATGRLASARADAAGRAAAEAAAAAAADAAVELGAARGANAARRERASDAEARLAAAKADADAAATARSAAAARAAGARAAAVAGAAEAEAATADAAAAGAAAALDRLTLLRAALGVTLERADAKAGVVGAVFGRAGALRLTLDARSGGGGARASLARDAADALPRWAAHLARCLVAGAGAPYAPADVRRGAAPAWAAAAARVAAAAAVVDAAVDAAANLRTVARAAPAPGGAGVVLTLVWPRARALVDVCVPLGAALDGGPRGSSPASIDAHPRVTAVARAAPPGRGKAVAAAVAAAANGAARAALGGGACLAAAAAAADAALRASCDDEGATPPRAALGAAAQATA